MAGIDNEREPPRVEVLKIVSREGFRGKWTDAVKMAKEINAAWKQHNQRNWQ
jgi:hypothetical protein